MADKISRSGFRETPELKVGLQPNWFAYKSPIKLLSKGSRKDLQCAKEPRVVSWWTWQPQKGRLLGEHRRRLCRSRPCQSAFQQRTSRWRSSLRSTLITVARLNHELVSQGACSRILPLVVRSSQANCNYQAEARLYSASEQCSPNLALGAFSDSIRLLANFSSRVLYTVRLRKALRTHTQ